MLIKTAFIQLDAFLTYELFTVIMIKPVGG